MGTKKSEMELLAKINDQEEQLNRYKKRLQDVVVAHKKLIGEKERLEESLKTLTSSMKPPEREIDENIKDSDKEINNLNEKVSKLAQTLSALAEEKRQVEVQFQLERKQLVQQNGQLEDKLKNLSTSIKSAKKVQVAEVENMKTQLNLENNQRELDFSLNIRELQQIITDERQKREEKETAVETLEMQLKQVTAKLNESKENEQRLEKQLMEVRKQLESETAPHSMMEKLKRELQIMKEQHNYAVHQEQVRALKAEDRARKLAVEHENRVSKLEQKLVQFSDLASNYDKHLQENQQTIMKLKNRLIQLELENSNNQCEDERAVSNEETLIQQLQHVKNQLILTCKDAKQLNKLRELLLDGLEDSANDDLNYKQLYVQLKQQFEEYVQNHAKKENGDDNISKHKIQTLKARLIEAETVINKLREEIELQNDQAREYLEKERRLWMSKTSSLESDYRNQIIILERELEKQRERVVAIVEEKEKQLLELQQHYFPVYSFSDDSSTDTMKPSRAGVRRQSSTLLYYLEDAARKEGEINRLRKQNNKLQMKLHDVEKELFQQIQTEIQLRQQIKRLEKQHDSAEELNNMYLKNVFLNYLMSTDSKMKIHMLNAIFAILKFSDLEMSRISKLKLHN